MDTRVPSAEEFYEGLLADPVRLSLWRLLANRIYVMPATELTRADEQEQDSIERPSKTSKTRQVGPQRTQHQFGPESVMEGGRMDHHREQQAQRIDEHMAPGAR
jgi:hypothetical protein